uniref:Uncharacterized protein n=1 Tax=Panagrolaimus sp. PS1159 TaxID=55785 RepID=A0AC35GN69_9BILA
MFKFIFITLFFAAIVSMSITAPTTTEIPLATDATTIDSVITSTVTLDIHSTTPKPYPMVTDISDQPTMSNPTHDATTDPNTSVVPETTSMSTALPSSSSSTLPSTTTSHSHASSLTFSFATITFPIITLILFK